MGLGQSKEEIIYNIPISEPKEGETAIYRNSKYSESLVTVPEEGMDTYQKILKASFERFPDRKMLGQRARQEDGSLASEYTWETYSEVQKLGLQLGSGIMNKKLFARK